MQNFTLFTNYSYWIAIAIVVPIWVFFYLKFINLRRELVISSFTIAPFVVIDYFTTPSYWTPQTLWNLWIYLSPSTISWWNLHNLSGIVIGIVPIEEVFFGLGFGCLIGPLYEFLTESHLAPNYKKKQR